MNIRIAKEDDLKSIVDIYNSSIPERMSTADLEPVPIESKLNWFYNHSERFPLFVAEIDNEIAGWAGLEMFYGRPAYEKTAEVSVYCSPNFKGKGLATSFIKHIIKHSHNVGITTLIAYIFDHNLPSINLFKKFGFIQWGHFPEIAELDGIKRGVLSFGLKLS